jgi:hypothetical protein
VPDRWGVKGKKSKARPLTISRRNNNEINRPAQGKWEEIWRFDAGLSRFGRERS